MKKTNTLYILGLIILLSVFLRFYRLADFPPGLNWDEVSHAYNSYSLLQTGRDQWGVALPVFNFRAYGDYPAALNLYFTVLPVALLGPTDIAVRLPHALIGVFSVITIFSAAYYWSKNRTLSLIAALFACIDPWLFFPARAVFQSNWAVFFLSLGLVYYFKRRLPLSLLFWGISMYAYHNTRIFIPLLVVPLLVAFRKIKAVWLVFLIVFLPVIISLVSPDTRARNTWVGIIDSGAVAGIEQVRNSSPLPPVIKRILHNRYTYFVKTAAVNYVGYFSPQFLFLSGGTQWQFSLPGFGLMPWSSLPFFYLGLAVLIIKKHRFLIYWLLLAPLPAAITRDQFAVIRSTTMLPAVQLVTALGAISLWDISKRLKLDKLFLVIVSISLISFLEQYLIEYLMVYPSRYSQSWQYGNRQLVEFVSRRYQSFDRVLITKKYGEPHEYFLWYLRYPPRQLSSSGLIWDYHANWYWVDAFDKFQFVNDWELAAVSQKLPAGKYLIISSPGPSPVGQEMTRIDFLDGSPAYIIRQYEK